MGTHVQIDVVQGGLGLDAYDEDVPALLEGVPHEPTCTSNLQHLDGTLSMARLDPGTATSEVFVCVGEQPELDFGGARNPDGQGFAAFGRVVEGMALVRNIQVRCQLVYSSQVWRDGTDGVWVAAMVQAGSANADPPNAEMGGLRGQLLDEPVLWRHVTRM